MGAEQHRPSSPRNTESTRRAPNSEASQRGRPDSTFLTTWAVLLIAGSAQFLVLLESTIINVAIPSIEAGLGDRGWLVWVLSGYLLAFGALLLPGGVWADRLGRRIVFLAALVAFAVTSVLCALAPSIETLVTARALQGASAGVLAASALGVVLSRYVGARERAIAMTVWSALGVVGAVVGSLIAGALIGAFGWPGVFWINVVAAALLLPFGWRTIPADTGSDPAADARSRVWPAFVIAGGAAAILAGLSIAETNLLPGVLVVIAGAGLVAATARAQLRSTAPILPVRLFRLASYRSATIGLFLVNGLMIATMFAYSRHLQDTFAFSAQAASLAVAPMALASLLVAFTADPIIGKLGETRTFRVAGIALLAGIGVALTVSLTGASWGPLIVGGTLIGAGIPAVFVILNRRAFAHVEGGEAGTASGFTNMLTTLGGATTVAIAAFASSFAGHAGAYAVLLTVATVIAALSLLPRRLKLT